MPEPLVFMMGKHPAPVPGDLQYSKNHMWCRPSAEEPGAIVFGFTAYAVRLMQDVYFLEWRVDTGKTVTLRQEIGFIETQKATSGLYAPVAGTVVRFNTALLNDPGTINLDCYGAGWLFELIGDVSQTLDASGYYSHLETGWDTTQRMIKGQINSETEL